MTDDEAKALGLKKVDILGEGHYQIGSIRQLTSEPVKPDGNFHVGTIHGGRVSLKQAEQAVSPKPFIGGVVRFMALRNKDSDPVFLPAIITRVWPDGECVGLRVFHSPAEPPVDEHWTICVSRGPELYQWSWPERA